MDTSHLNLLQELGLTDQEARSYLALLELGSASVAEIAGRAGIKRTSVYNFIDHLVSMGVIKESLRGTRRTYQAIAPTTLLDLQERRLTLVKERMGDLQALTNLSPQKPRMQYFEGTQQLQQIERETLNCDKELLAIWNRKRVIEQLGGVRFMEKLDKERRAKGIKIRLIAVRDEDAQFIGGGSGAKDMRKTRWAPAGLEFPMAISIFDNGKVGLITSQDEGFGILIDSKEYEQTMRNLFESFWLMSSPIE